jgi:hypothetical protein
MPKRETIEIQEPTIQTLGKNRSCLKRSCFGGCGCLFLICIAFLLMVRLLAVPNLKELKTLPDSFPSELVPMYDKENIERISYLSAKEKGNTLERLAYIPKIIITPLYLMVEQYLPSNYQILSDTRDLSGRERFTQIINKPLFANNSTFTIEWTHLSARPSFIKEYYTDELTKTGFTVTSTPVTPQYSEEITFTHTTEQINGTLRIIDPSPTDRGTDEVILELNLVELP